MYRSNRLEQEAHRPLEMLGKVWGWLFLLILVAFFSFTGHGFFNFFNVQNIVTDMAFVLLVALGQTFVVISGGIDLSTGYIMGLSAVVSAQVVILLGGRLPLALVVLLGAGAGILVGLLPGLLNGLIIARLSVPPFIVTLGMYGIARGAGFILANGQPVSIQLSGIGDIGNNYLLYIRPDMGVSFFAPPAGLSDAQLRNVLQILPLQLVVSIIVLFFCAWLLAKTRFGLHVYAIGGSPEAARRNGIPFRWRIIQIYTLSALLAALAGVLYMLRYTSGAADAGDALLIDSIAAVVIGGASLFGGEGSIMGTLIGTLIISVIQNGLVIVGVDPFWQFITVGIVIILAVLIDQAKARMSM
jgi:ribose/xylose/arabinose/galactoside ABC-type transport system permease subunit